MLGLKVRAWESGGRGTFGLTGGGAAVWPGDLDLCLFWAYAWGNLHLPWTASWNAS